jgi:predicted aldo/keto reductase-like oxidoreductase
MNYRKNPKNGDNLSLLAFGAMRLPASIDDPNGIDVEESVRMIRYAIDHGINYIDTAYTYYEGDSERTVAKALQDGYGDKVYVATKLPTMRLKKEKEQDLFLEGSLEHLEMDYIDYYLLHGMKERYWPVVQRLNTIGYLEKKKSEGLIRNMGFSYHGESFELFKEILNAGPWDFCQIQLNYMDAGIQAGVKGLRYAASLGLPVMIMEPLKGGKLTDRIPAAIQKYWDAIDVKRTSADWGLRWVANLPEVTTILSGMSNFDQLAENLKILSDADVGCLSEKELSIIAEMADEYSKLIPYPCTSCGYCRSGCPKEIDIPLVISMRNEASMFDAEDKIKYEINHLVRKPPSTCIACGKCEDVCPQHLKIIDILKEIKDNYEDESQQWWREYV